MNTLYFFQKSSTADILRIERDGNVLVTTRNYSGTLASHRCCRDQSHSWIRDEESATLNIFVGNMTPIKLYQSFTSFYTMLIQYYNVIQNLRNALQVLYCVVDIIWLIM